MESIISGTGASITAVDDNDEGYNAEDKELDVIDTDEINEISEFKHKIDANDHDVNEGDENDDGKKRTPVWKKPQKKKQAKKQDKNAGKQKQKQKSKPKPTETASAQGDSAQNVQVRETYHPV